MLFSDAVVAIAITLLALELPVPEGHDVSEFWHSVRANDGHYLAFLISFLVIAMAWGEHHRVFRTALRVDTRLRKINLVWLMMIILNPFATKMLIEEGHDTVATHALRWGFYALLQVLGNVALLTLTYYLRTLNPAGTGAGVDGNEGSYGVIIGFGLSIPVFFATTNAWVLWILGPLLTQRVYRRFWGRGDRELRDA
ncbi:hypothetical protein BGM09_33555 [Streptomyces sp. CBMA29]|nr:hypothetical protein [Streptomyces sp. CBMA29]